MYVVAETASSFFNLLFWPTDGGPMEERRHELFARCCVEQGEDVLLRMSYSQFNATLTECDQPVVSKAFYDFFFPSLESGLRLFEFKDRVFQYMKVAIWKYGSPRVALHEMRRLNSFPGILDDIPIKGVCPINPDRLRLRPPFNVIADLTPDQRQRLGYLTSTPESDNLTETAKEIGRKNTREYLFLDELDVYVATAMRTSDDFARFHAFTHEVFHSRELVELQVRFFDPTLSYCDEPVQKGLLESLMLRRAKITLFVAGTLDTFGKDSECASTLAQGKPVVVYVEKAPNSASDEEKKNLDQRAELFRGVHPLSLQVSVRDGIPKGLIVVRTVEDCRKIIRQLLLHEVDTLLDLDDNGYVLRERNTRSRIGIAVKNPELARAFENYYFELEM